MKVGFKKLTPLAKVPTYGSEEAAGADLYSVANGNIWPGERKLVPTGLAIQLPPGFEAQIRPRSGLALKHGITVVNTPGTIDSDYRGEIKVLLINHGTEVFYFSEGDRLAQMVVAPALQVQFDEVETLGATERGVKGYGSTGVHQNEPTTVQ